MAQQIQFRRDTAAQWTSANPVLGQGELGLETDTKKFKIGDGATSWASLTYMAAQIAADAALTGIFTQRANNLSDVASVTTARSNLGASQEVVRTAVKTSSYTASAGDLVPVDTTSGSVTVTLPTAPADKSRNVVKHVVRGGTNTVSVVCGGSDVFNVTAGVTTLTLTLVLQAVTVVYSASAAIWTAISDDLALSQLDVRYDVAGAAASAQTASLQKSSNLSDLASASTARTNLGLAAIAASGSGSDLTDSSVTSAKILDGTIAVADMSAASLAGRNLFLSVNYQ